MQAGKLREVITIEENRYIQDGIGAPIDDWQFLVDLRASVEPLSGREYFAAQQTQAEQVTRFKIRYPNFQIKPNMRIKFRGRIFDIQGVINQNEMNVDVFIMAVEQIKYAEEEIS